MEIIEWEGKRGRDREGKDRRGRERIERKGKDIEGMGIKCRNSHIFLTV